MAMHCICLPTFANNVLRNFVCLSNVSTFSSCRSHCKFNFSNKQRYELCETKLLNFFPLSKSSTLSDVSASKTNLLSTYEKIKEVVQDDFIGFDDDIKKLLETRIEKLKDMCYYYFDGQGKSIRPLTMFLMARACNFNFSRVRKISENQRKVAMISEMIHISSLIHDDVVDTSNVRRGKDSINYICGDRNAVMAGNYIMSKASCLLASIDDHEVTSIITTIVDDLVRGEFLQLNQQNQFDHYLKKTYKKTASLIANCCKAVAHLSGCEGERTEDAYQFGRNLGIAFQLIDDLLDYVSSSENLGKPAAADLRLGLATAPVFFACEKYPDLNEMISRKFSNPGDQDYALWAVKESDALEETRLLAQHYSKNAVSCLSNFHSSVELDGLVQLSKLILRRSR